MVFSFHIDHVIIDFTVIKKKIILIIINVMLVALNILDIAGDIMQAANDVKPIADNSNVA